MILIYEFVFPSIREDQVEKVDVKGDPVRAITSENASSDSRRALQVETASDLPCLRQVFQPDPLGLPPPFH